MPVDEALRLGNVFFNHDRSAEISLQVVLEAEEDRLLEHSPARFQIAVNKLSPRRILLPMRELVTIRLKNEVVRFGFQHGSGDKRTQGLYWNRREAWRISGR